MQWYLPESWLHPITYDVPFRDTVLWMRPAQDCLIFESVLNGVVLANKENPNVNDPKLEPRAMAKPRGVFPFYADNYSAFGRAPFEVQAVDAGWLLEHTSGAPLGYIHIEWSVHLPKKPELDPCIGLHCTLHEIVLRPCVRGMGLGNTMVDTCIKAMEHHANLLLASHARLRDLRWSTNFDAHVISPQGDYALCRLKAGTEEVLNRAVRSHSIHLNPFTDVIFT